MDELMGAIPSPDPIAAKTIRVCKVARKFLVFDLESVTILRRVFHTSGTLVGTTPQQPAQNIFLGLPVELTSDEAGALVQNGVAYVVDAAEAHRETLGERFLDLTIRSAYVEVLRQRILTASHAHTVKAVKSPPGIRTRLRSSCMPSELSPRLFDGAADGFSSVQNPGSIAKTDGSSSNCKRDLILGLTLNSSVDLIARRMKDSFGTTVAVQSPFCSFLNGKSFYLTPGLRFGAQFSVYPGDPLRFHAHFMANEFGWDCEVPLLDFVSGGRLATSVKKSFLIGGLNDKIVQPISIEWAGM